MSDNPKEPGLKNSAGSDISYDGVIPCDRPEALMKQVEIYADELMLSAHSIGSHGLTDKDFYSSGILEGAIEKLRGRKSATMTEKRDFIRLILNHLQDIGEISEWEPAGGNSRHDYEVKLPDSTVIAIEAKGCLDGNNTTIWERPPNANEFVIWSICQNKSSDIAHNVWSGINTRLGPTVITRKEVVDGVIMWDFLCGTADRPCPKLLLGQSKTTDIGQHSVPPPCIYILPATVPEPYHNPEPPVRKLEDVKFLSILNKAFGGDASGVHSVGIAIKQSAERRQRKTKIVRNGVTVRESKWSTIKRTT